jgi:tetratricopeptide (TPR) repeat protein
VKEAAEKAIELKPTLAQPYAQLGNLERAQLAWDAAFAHAEKALSLDPQDLSALTLLGALQVTAGYIEAGTGTAKRALRVDPLYGYSQIGIMYAAFVRGDDASGIAIARREMLSGAEYAPVAALFLVRFAQTDDDRKDAEARLRAFAALGWRQNVLEPVMAAVRSPAARPKAVEAIMHERAKNTGAPLLWPLFAIGADSVFLETLQAELSGEYQSGVSNALGVTWRVIRASPQTQPQFKELMRKAGLVDYWRKHGWPDRCRVKGEDDFECS